MTTQQKELVNKIRASAWKDYLNEKRWCAWFQGDAKPDGDGFAKVPIGSHSDPQTWNTFDELCAKLKPGQGIGYNFLGGDLHPLDFDHVRNPQTGVICPEAMVTLSRLQSFSEISISGRGIHCLFKGNVRGKQLTETCIQYWNPKNSPRFFTVTADVVGDAFTTIKDVGEEFNYIFATARHVSAKCREELRAVDYDQWAKLPVERVVEEQATKEKPKVKTRKMHKDFNMEEFLSWAGIRIDNVTNNDIGKMYRVTSCPIKGEPHVGQNGTTTNFGLTADGGLMFHCQSTGCVEYGFADALKMLEEKLGKYSGKIYEEKQQDGARVGCVQSLAEIKSEHRQWLWPGYLGLNKFAHFGGASSEGKSPVTLDLAARVSAGLPWPDGTENVLGPRSVIVLAAEDDWEDTIRPRLMLAGANDRKIFRFFVTQKTVELTPTLDGDLQRLEGQIQGIGDVALIVIDPITNYLGSKKMNAEDEIRGGILMPLATVAKNHNCCIITVGHLNKRGSEVALLQRLMGCAAFGGVARDVYLFGDDPDEDDKYAHVMSEIRNKSAPKLKYRTEMVKVAWDGQDSDVLSVRWGGVSNADTDEVVNARKQGDKTKSREAAAFIKAFLRDGAKSTKSIEDALKDAGVDCSDLPRAARKAGAKSRKQKGSKTSAWEWCLATLEQASFDIEQPKKPPQGEQECAA